MSSAAEPSAAAGAAFLVVKHLHVHLDARILLQGLCAPLQLRNVNLRVTQVNGKANNSENTPPKKIVTS